MEILKKLLRAGLVMLIGALALSDNALAQGFIIPRPMPPQEIVLPQLTSHNVKVEIVDQVSQVTVEQTFYNDSHHPIEGTYYFPLPKAASVSNFKMMIDGKTIGGELLDKDKARQLYEEIVRRNIDPALLEYVDHNLFCARIFPIPPRKERRIVLEYSLLLEQDGDLIQFTYPLRGRVAADRFVARTPHPPRPPRYLPEPPYVIPLQEWDNGNSEQHKSAPAQQKDHSQVIVINLQSQIQIKNIYSPSHSIDISRIDDHHARISYEGKQAAADDNFVLYYSLSQKDFGLSLLTYRSSEKENGFFMVLLSPKTDITADEMINKDIVFILDVSGSMEGDKLKQAKDALKYCINHLDRNDRFNLITFSTETRLFQKGLVNAAEFRSDVLKHIESLEARGGTNIHDALMEALAMKPSSNRPISVVFITDGLPTVGETDIGRIISHVSDNNKQQMKIFTFGVGYDVNTVLLDKIAASSRAVSDYIEPNENIEHKIASFYDKISHPVLTNLSLDYGGIEVADVFPQKLPDLFQGSQLIILGRYKNERKANLKLSGRMKDEEKQFSYEADFTKDNERHDFLPHLWATRKIGYLMDEIRLHGENKELKDEIVALSKKYGVLSPYTSFLIQEALPLAQYNTMRPSVSRRNSLEKMNHVPFQIFEAEAIPTGLPSMDPQVQSVKMSKAAREMKERETAVPDRSDKVKRIGAHTFYLKDGFWIDSDYKDERTIDIKYGSQAYLELIMQYPEAAKFAVLGERVIFRVRGRFVKISEMGSKRFQPSEIGKFFQEHRANNFDSYH